MSRLNSVCQSAMHLSQDKLTPSEELGDLMRRAGDNDAALGIYQKANVPQKVIEGLAAKGDFEALSKFRYGCPVPTRHPSLKLRIPLDTSCQAHAGARVGAMAKLVLL